MPRWLDGLQQNTEAFQDFTAHLEMLRRLALREMEDAASWEGVLEARGKKKILDRLLSETTMDAREGVTYERTFGQQRRTRSA